MFKRKLTAAKKKEIFESLKPTEIYKALSEEADFLHGHPLTLGSEERPLPAIVIGLGHDVVYRARQIERFLAAIERDHGPAFEEVTRNRGAKTFVTREAGLFFDDLMGSELANDTPCELSEEVELVFKTLREFGVDISVLKSPTAKDPITGRLGWEIFNDLAIRIREGLREAGLLTRRRRRREQARRNYLSAEAYIASLFKRHARLLVLRVDLGYRDWTNPECGYEARKTADDIRRDLMRLLNNRRTNALFDDMVGYIAKIEHGVSKGFHAHVILFFDGSNKHKDAWYASEVGRYWIDSITNGDGIFYNCNAAKWKYRRLGIGPIDHHDIGKRENLLTVVAYLTKAEQFMRVRDGGRTFFKGMVKPRTSAAGRPRTH